jgi:hypothetical protein
MERTRQTEATAGSVQSIRIGRARAVFSLPKKGLLSLSDLVYRQGFPVVFLSRKTFLYKTCGPYVSGSTRRRRNQQKPEKAKLTLLTEVNALREVPRWNRLRTSPKEIPPARVHPHEPTNNGT